MNSKAQSGATVVKNAEASKSPRHGSLFLPVPKVSNHNQGSNIQMSGQIPIVSNNFVGSNQINIDVSHQRQQRAFTKPTPYTSSISPTIQFAYLQSGHQKLCEQQQQHFSTNEAMKPSSAQYPSEPSYQVIHPHSRIESCFKKNQQRPVMTTMSTQNLMKIGHPANPQTLQFSMAKKFSGDPERRPLISRR